MTRLAFANYIQEILSFPLPLHLTWLINTVQSQKDKKDFLKKNTATS